MDDCCDIAIIQTGQPPLKMREQVGEQPDWFKKSISDITQNIKVFRPFLADDLPKPGSFKCVLVTGSWSMVTDKEEWSEQVATWLKKAVHSNTRIFGVCYGHQLLAHALGGKVKYNPNGREFGFLPVMLNRHASKTSLLCGLPSSFHTFLSHSQTISELPPGAISLAASDMDDNQIVMYTENALSVQFHPEFTFEILRFCDEKYYINTFINKKSISEAAIALSIMRNFVSSSL